METYNTPKQGKYYFSIPIFYGIFKRYSTPVEVIAEIMFGEIFLYKISKTKLLYQKYKIVKI